jgi:ubiquinone/menaquinone biosynthesis C-methylase UbiE
MIEHARARLHRDGVDTSHYEFRVYDGLNVPFPDRSIDHVYSVACLQHVPKLYVYHLFSEIRRVLRGGYAALHFLSFSFLPRQPEPFLSEVKKQLIGTEGHWHHFYSRDELIHVLTALGALDVTVVEEDGSLWTAFR